MRLQDLGAVRGRVLMFDWTVHAVRWLAEPMCNLAQGLCSLDKLSVLGVDKLWVNSSIDILLVNCVYT